MILMAPIVTDFYASILAVELDSYGSQGFVIGLVFAVPCISYTLLSVLIEHFLERFQRRLLIAMGTLFLGIAIIFMGPSPTLMLPRSIPIIVFGLSF